MQRKSLLTCGYESQDTGVEEADTVQKKVFKTLEEVEREHIASVPASEEHFERAAEVLGISSVTLWRKRKRYGLP